MRKTHDIAHFRANIFISVNIYLEMARNKKTIQIMYNLGQLYNVIFEELSSKDCKKVKYALNAAQNYIKPYKCSYKQIKLSPLNTKCI